MDPNRDNLPTFQFASQQAWEAWLDQQHAASTGVWLRIAKAGSGTTTVSYAQALEGALCYGWIDGQKAAQDEEFWLQRFTPRGPRSMWSRVNRDKAMELLEQGRLLPAGLARVEEARQDGRWDAAYEGQRLAAVPEDLQRALEQHPAALALFTTLDKANRYAILYRVQTAKKTETRAKRIEQFVAMLERGETIHPRTRAPLA